MPTQIRIREGQAVTTRNPFEVPSEMRDLASRSVEQARKAFETFIGAAQKSTTAVDGSDNPVQQGLVDATKRTVSFAETNMKAAFGMAERLVQAKTLEEVMKIQAEFVQSQAQTLQSQMQEVGAAVQKQLGDTAETVQKMARKPAKR